MAGWDRTIWTPGTWPTRQDAVDFTRSLKERMRAAFIYNDPVISVLNFTTSEPASPDIGDRHLSNASGYSSVTNQLMYVNCIYEWSGSEWINDNGEANTAPSPGAYVYVEEENQYYKRSGYNFVGIGNPAFLVEPPEGSYMPALDLNRWKGIYDLLFVNGYYGSMGLCRAFSRSHNDNGTIRSLSYYNGGSTYYVPSWSKEDLMFVASGGIAPAGKQDMPRIPFGVTVPEDWEGWMDWTDELYSYGQPVAYDIATPLFFQTLQRILNLMVWRMIDPVYVDVEHKRGMSPDWCETRAEAYAAAVAEYTSISDTWETARQASYGYQDRWYKCLLWGTRSKQMISYRPCLAELNFDVAYYTWPDEPYDGGDAGEFNQQSMSYAYRESLYLETKSNVSSGTGSKSTTWIGSVAVPPNMPPDDMWEKYEPNGYGYQTEPMAIVSFAPNGFEYY